MDGDGLKGDSVGLLLFAGDDLVSARIPGPVRVVDPPPPLEPLRDFGRALATALAAPLGSPPLSSLARHGSRVTVAFDDPCLPLPPMVSDPRRAVLESVVACLEQAGVLATDLTLVCANGLHRRWTKAELAPLVGPRLLRRYGDRLGCYDAEDPRGSRSLGSTSSGLAVEVSRSVADADLVVYVGVPWTEMNGGHKSIACGLSTRACIDQHHGPEVQAASPLMDPGRSLMHRRLWEIGRHIGEQVPVFQVECVMNNRLWAGPLKTLRVGARALPPALRPARRLPRGVLRTGRRLMRSWYQVAGVWAGAVEPVHEAVVERLSQARARVPRPADVLLLGLPDMSPYAVHSDMNPVLAANLGLGYAFQFGRGGSLVRPGGWVVLANPFSPRFHRRHHVAYRRFWDEVLPLTDDAETMHREIQPVFAADPGLVGAYRFGHAYHPVHPFYAWYWMARARAHLGGVVVAGPDDPGVVRRLGFLSAKTVEEAVAVARDRAGGAGEVVFQATPPVFTVDVGGGRA